MSDILVSRTFISKKQLMYYYALGSCLQIHKVPPHSTTINVTLCWQYEGKLDVNFTTLDVFFDTMILILLIGLFEVM